MYIPDLIKLELGSYVSKLSDSVYNRFPKTLFTAYFASVAGRR